MLYVKPVFCSLDFVFAVHVCSVCVCVCVGVSISAAAVVLLYESVYVKRVI